MLISFSPKMSTDILSFFFLELRGRSRLLADVFEKNEQKNKTMFVYSWLPGAVG